MTRRVTVLLYPSFHAGLCRSVTEAMASGLPIVASTGGTIPEVVGSAAALFDPLDSEEMAKRIVEIAASDSLREEMACAGREICKRYTCRSHGEVVAEAYQSIVS